MLMNKRKKRDCIITTPSLTIFTIKSRLFVCFKKAILN